MSEQSLSSQIFTRKMLICVFTGFSSGLPLFVLSQMLPVWLTDKGLSVELIGALTGVMVPYGLKFLWAPLLDRYFPHFLGRRRSWLLISQVDVYKRQLKDDVALWRHHFHFITKQEFIFYCHFSHALFVTFTGKFTDKLLAFRDRVAVFVILVFIVRMTCLLYTSAPNV